MDVAQYSPNGWRKKMPENQQQATPPWRTSSSAPDLGCLVRDSVFAADDEARDECRSSIRKMALEHGAYPASIQALYEAAGKGQYKGVTVPAINIRGLTYEVSRAVFRAALKSETGAFIFEIARSEIGYTKQKPGEYASCVLAAAIREGYKGPVFIQGDHFQVNAAKYGSNQEKELSAIEELISEAIAAGFYNIDIDASTLVDIKKPDLDQQQEANCSVTARLTHFIRKKQPQGVTISVGGEIGEVGGRNSTVGDLRAFMKGYQSRLGAGQKGISKISVQTGTTHGGVVLPDGSVAQVELDFATLKELSRVAREEYGLAGAVQHGASTLPEKAFELFPQNGAAEVHLATGFQNIIYDNPQFPRDLRLEINEGLKKMYSEERKAGETDEQFIYKTRKKAFGDYKKQLWEIPADSLDPIMTALEKQFSFLFKKLNVVESRQLVSKYIDISASRS
ncbi:MAG: class II fructose-bisphosphate aldolase [Chloroflexi bacterium]|nr:class II fructose-bisphosphate aldolase [Chloroflexota bacterium]